MTDLPFKLNADMDIPALVRAIQANFDALAGGTAELEGSYMEQSSSVLRVREDTNLALDIARTEMEGDGQPPGSSPAPIIQGGVGFIAVSWTPITNSSTVTYDVHISTDSGFTADGTNFVGEMPAGGMYFIRKLPGGTDDLAYDTDYYVRLVARDVDGSAAQSATATTRLVPANTPDIAVGAIVAAHILAGSIRTEHLAAVLVVGSTIQTFPEGPTPTQGVRISGQTGLTAYDAGGNIVVSLPTTGSNFLFRGVIEALGLTVEGRATFRADTVIDQGADIILSETVADPSTGPSLVQDVPLTTLAAGVGSDFDAAYPWHDGTNLFLTRFQDESQPEVVKFSSDGTSEVAASEPQMPSIGPWSSIFVVRHSGQWIGLARRESDQDMRWLVWDDDGTGGLPLTLLAHGGYFQDEADNGLSSDVSLTYDGTKLYTLQEDGTSNNALIKVFTPQASAVPTFDGAGSNVTITENVFNLSKLPVPFIRSNADFGATRYILRVKYGSLASRFITFTTAGVNQVNEYWDAADDGFSRGFWYNSGFHELVAQFIGRWSYTGWVWTTESAKYWVKYSWSDNTNESAGSPTSSLTLLKRRQLTITTPDFPTGITEVRIYMDRGGSEPTLDHQVDSATKSVVRTSFTAGGGAPLSTSTLPAATPSGLLTSNHIPLIRANGIPRYKGAYTANQNIGDAVLTFIKFSEANDVVDTDDFHTNPNGDNLNTTANSDHEFSLPFTGQYLVVLNCTFASNATGMRRLQLNLEGVLYDRSNPRANATEATRTVLVSVVDATAGDDLTAAVFQDSGGALALNGAKLAIIYLGPSD